MAATRKKTSTNMAAQRKPNDLLMRQVNPLNKEILGPRSERLKALALPARETDKMIAKRASKRIQQSRKVGKAGAGEFARLKKIGSKAPYNNAVQAQDLYDMRTGKKKAR